MSLPTDKAETMTEAAWRLLTRVWWRALILSGSIFACYKLRSVLITLIVTAIIAYVLDPLVVLLYQWPPFIRFDNWGSGNVIGWFGRKLRRASPEEPVSRTGHQRRTSAVMFVAIIATLVVWQGYRWVATPLSREIKRMSSARGKQEMTAKMNEILRWYDKSVPESIASPKIIEQLQKANFPELVKNSAPVFTKRLSETFSAFVELVLIPVLALYILIDGRQLKHEMVGLIKKRHRREALLILREFNRIMRAFIFGQFLLCSIAAVIVFIGLASFQVHYSFILAVFAGLTRAIPVVGPIFGAIPIIILLLIEKGVGPALAFTIFFSLLHLIETKLIMPYLLGKQVELHPVIIIVVLLIGSEAGHLFLGEQMGGLLGMFFAVPCAALIRALLRRYWLQIKELERTRKRRNDSDVACEEVAPNS